MTTNNLTVPAYLPLKFEQKCKACGEIIPVGKLAFYMKEGNQVWHGKCGSDTWKVTGTPYAIRRQAAIANQLAMKNDKDLIKLALRRFRRELIIKTVDMKFKSEVFQYLKRNHLIEEDGFKQSYVIIPKGFNWDVDLGEVRMPGRDENIMVRDEEVEIKEEEL